MVVAPLSSVSGAARRTKMELVTLWQSCSQRLSSMIIMMIRTTTTTTTTITMSNVWGLIALLLVIINLKHFPLVYHFRIFRPLLRHVYLTRKRPCGPSSIFQAAITTSHAPLIECDFNGHKSNSSYFVDFDVGRTEVLSALLAQSIDTLRRNKKKKNYPKAKVEPRAESEPNANGDSDDGKEAKGRPYVALGGVAALFKREILPYRHYEIWTRILSWDEKWIYLVAHVVRPGEVRPKAYSLQPWMTTTTTTTTTTGQDERKGDSTGNGSDGDPRGRPNENVNGKVTAAQASEDPLGGSGSGIAERPHPAIYASSVAKYVFKRGRLTIPPEIILRTAGLLPPRPTDDGDGKEGTDGPLPPSSSSTTTTATTQRNSSSSSSSGTEDVAEPSLDSTLGEGSDSATWDWDRIERERLRGMKIAKSFKELEAINHEFRGEKEPVLGIY